MTVVNLQEKLSRFQDHWNPRIVGELNDAYIKVVKIKGTFVWHAHANEDELFLVLSGTLRIQLRDGERILQPGEFTVIPRGVEHCPVADDEVSLVLIEPKATRHTGDVISDMTVTEQAWI
jgi:mannose-6-phosphate isomerase-like protein (cupin superfamily)